MITAKIKRQPLASKGLLCKTCLNESKYLEKFSIEVHKIYEESRTDLEGGHRGESHVQIFRIKS